MSRSGHSRAILSKRSALQLVIMLVTASPCDAIPLPAPPLVDSLPGVDITQCAFAPNGDIWFRTIVVDKWRIHRVGTAVTFDLSGVTYPIGGVPTLSSLNDTLFVSVKPDVGQTEIRRFSATGSLLSTLVVPDGSVRHRVLNDGRLWGERPLATGGAPTLIASLRGATSYSFSDSIHMVTTGTSPEPVYLDNYFIDFNGDMLVHRYARDSTNQLVHSSMLQVYEPGVGLRANIPWRLHNLWDIDRSGNLYERLFNPC